MHVAKKTAPKVLRKFLRWIRKPWFVPLRRRLPGIRLISEVDPWDSSLYGVMRALFPEKTQEIRSDVVIDDEPTPINQPPPQREEKKEEKKISEQIQKRLSCQMEQWLGNFRDPVFAERCSARQLVQAAAYPLAVGILGTRYGWVSRNDAVSWARHVFDTLFQIAPPGSAEFRGILDSIRNRLRG